LKGVDARYLNKFNHSNSEKEGKNMLRNRLSQNLAEERESFRKFAEQITGWPVKDTKITKIKVNAFSDRIKRNVSSDIQVGQELDLNLANIPHESVLAIFESKEFLVITPDKSSPNGTVYFFDPNKVLDIEKET